MPKPFVVRIRWGSAATREENPDGVCEYEFDTKAELDAFHKGVDESSGWSEYEVVDDFDPAKRQPGEDHETHAARLVDEDIDRTPDSGDSPDSEVP